MMLNLCLTVYKECALLNMFIVNTNVRCGIAIYEKQAKTRYKKQVELQCIFISSLTFSIPTHCIAPT